MSTTVQRVETLGDILVNGGILTTCITTDGGSAILVGTVVNCHVNIPIITMNRWRIEEFGLYRSTAFGLAPDFYVRPAIKDPGVYPNTVAATTGLQCVAAAVDCITVGIAAALRWAFRRENGGPCIFDTEYGFTICSPGGVASDNNIYFNSTNVQLNGDAVVKDVFCPTSFGSQAATPTSTPIP